MPDSSAATIRQEPEPDMLTPGSILVERYVYATRTGGEGVQWCVHKVGRDGSLDQLHVGESRREALLWAVENA